eukprot:191447-Prymnesium_polylepis.1
MNSTLFKRLLGRHARVPREARRADAFNLTPRCCHDLLELKPTLQSWVPHVAQFIVPRQMVELGDLARRSADACESFGAMFKKLIKHSTCRRRMMGNEKTTHKSKATSQSSRARWQQTFNRGYSTSSRRSPGRVSVSPFSMGRKTPPFGSTSTFGARSPGKATWTRKSAEESPAVMRPLRE